jgi:hypothetical protein
MTHRRFRTAVPVSALPVLHAAASLRPRTRRGQSIIVAALPRQEDRSIRAAASPHCFLSFPTRRQDRSSQPLPGYPLHISPSAHRHRHRSTVRPRGSVLKGAAKFPRDASGLIFKGDQIWRAQCCLRPDPFVSVSGSARSYAGPWSTNEHEHLAVRAYAIRSAGLEPELLRR